MSRPPSNVEFTKTLLKKLYGVEVDKLKELNGYDDRNYYIKTTESKEFIVKITNYQESCEPGLLESINAVILHLYNNGIKVTVPQVNSRGTYLTYEQIPESGQQIDVQSDKAYGFRLLHYISGKVLLDVPFTPAILRECGEVLARITTAMENFSNPVLSTRKFRESSTWSLLSVLDVRQYLDAVDSALHRSIVSLALDEFESQVMNRLDEFEHAIIHGDFNEQNIIVEPDPDQTPGEQKYHFKGVIDFGDVQFAPKVFDLAIHLAYAMLEFKAGPQILGPGLGLSGYLKHRKLTENELNVLYVCIKARLCQSLVLGAHAFRKDPTNIYVLSTAKNGWPALRALHDCQPNEILDKWLNIDKYFPN